jgi:hypothetical protein
LLIEPPAQIGVPLTRAEVEAYHREHLDKYSAPEMVSVRHILIRPSGETEDASERARRRVLELRERALQGEDFAGLARQYSEDVATREKGGDLGSFARGAMLESFEQVAFRMQPGEIGQPVRTEVGWHLIKCENHEPVHAEPLRYLYSNVGWDAATEKADRIAARRADSLLAVLKRPADALRAAQKLGIHPDRSYHRIGTRSSDAKYASFQIRLEQTAPGQMVPGTVWERAAGSHLVAWVDSIAPARAPDWSSARTEALQRYRRDAGQRSLEAKRAELDSLRSAGWSLDSLAALFGGFARVKDASPGTALQGLGGEATTDSVVFGTHRDPPRLREGEVTGWLDLPGGLARLRLLQRIPPDPARLSTQVETDRRLQLERRMYGLCEDLKERYPVRILDPALRDTPAPVPPPPRD